VFALFCEDVDLMPLVFKQPVFRFLVDGAKKVGDTPEDFAEQMRQLFEAMNGERSTYILQPVPYFNGGIFAESAPGAGDAYEVLNLMYIPGGIALLEEVSEADWRYVNPTIFGTLFEGALDTSKRAQLGAHYTGEDDIRLIVEPVLMQPLYREWDDIRAEAELLMQTYLASDTTPRATQSAKERLIALHDGMMTRLGTIKVLDPACGSGNFLYMSLRALKDLEGRVRKFFEPLGLPFRDVVTPRQLYGIEKDEFAASLAKVVVWIGYLQWRYEDEGILHPYQPRQSVQHPRALPHPIIQDKNRPDEPDHILCADAIMRYDADGKPYEPEWVDADVIVGNPPFLGGYKQRSELSDTYIDKLFELYDKRVSSPSDLVCYWFEKALKQIVTQKAKRAGLLATNSIRGGTNREVLKHIKDSGDIFIAWSDREWVLDGAAVRVSMIGFDNGLESSRILDGIPVSAINSDLTTSVDITIAKKLPENMNLCVRGNEKHGAFDISHELAQKMMSAVNSSGVSNTDVILPYLNAYDIVQRSRNKWIVDFFNFPLEQAEKYEMPIEYIQQHVKPERDKNNRTTRRERWWQHGEITPSMRRTVMSLERFIVTPSVSKHRIYVWLKGKTIPDHALQVFSRDDDYFFGVLHSKVHEVWSLRMGTWLGKGNDPRYTPTTTFETFPFPWSPGKEPVKDNPTPALPVNGEGAGATIGEPGVIMSRYEKPGAGGVDQAAAYGRWLAISEAAKRLHKERDAWLNPPDLVSLGAKSDSKALKERTLTNLYNALVGYRAGKPNGEKAARDFAPRLAELHRALDEAVCAAYGWDNAVLDDEEEILRRLLALNLERAATQSAAQESAR
jgi:hypothetical protein